MFRMPRLELNRSLHAPQNWGYKDRLRKTGHRITPQREQILELLHRAPHRMGALELCARAEGMNPATVYRNLKFLIEVGLVRAVELQGELSYELVNPNAPHHHLLCRKCGLEQIVSAHAATGFYAQLQETYGFRPDTNHWVIYGLCERCQSNEERVSKPLI